MRKRFYSDFAIRYGDKLKNNCRKFYEAIKFNSNFDINFGDSSVFLIIRIKNGGYKQYTEFIDELNEYLKGKDLNIIGTSFGFGYPRIEIIDKGEEGYCIRLSVGYYEGPLIMK